VNGWFICDRGQFGYRFASNKDRPRKFLVDGQEKAREEAVTSAVRIISDAVAKYGPGSVAFVGSPRTSLENNFALKKLAILLGTENICFSADPVRERKDGLAVSSLNPESSRSLRDVEFSDFIIAVGADPINEAPMLALLMRQAALKGARIVVIDPRPVKLPFYFTHIPALPGEFAGKLAELTSGGAKDYKNPMIICGTDIAGTDAINACSETAKKFGIGLLYTLSAANSFGASVMASRGPDFEGILSGMESKAIRVVIALESDPLGRYPDKDRVAGALKKVDSLIVLDYLSTETAKAAGRATGSVFFPTAAYAEMDGIFVNNEGRAQAFSRAYIPGIPINSMGPRLEPPELHPPREFFSEVPGRSYPAWEYLRDIADGLKMDCREMESLEAIRASLSAEMARFAPIAGLSPESEGTVIKQGYEYAPPPVNLKRLEPPGEGPILYAVELTFGTEEISIHSDKTQLRAPEPYVLMNAEDTGEYGLKDGERVKITSGNLSLSCILKTSASCARGAAFAPRLQGFGANALSGKNVKITGERG
ncbi:MAG: molybdopterin-dependent oxidoreductase, partial [Nitrospirota bacterium]